MRQFQSNRICVSISKDDDEEEEERKHKEKFIERVSIIEDLLFDGKNFHNFIFWCFSFLVSFCVALKL